MDSARPASSQVSKIRIMSKASSYLAGGLVQELTCESRTKRERKWKSGSTGNWSHGAPTSCEATGTIREDTALAFRNGMFRTGDIGYQDSDGYFYILDRLKDMIVTGGENVYSGEVEAVIYKHPAVREVAVFGIPDPQWGEIVMACVVLKPGMVLSANDLTSHCRQFLANYKIPRRFEFSDTELPKSGSGKILKRILRERFWAHEERAVELSKHRLAARRSSPTLSWASPRS